MTATRIAPHLYQGGRSDLVTAQDFDVVVLCAMEVQLPGAKIPGVAIYRCPLDDSDTRGISVEEWRLADKASAVLAPLVRGGRRCLVTCQQGRNRSGLVNALTLHRLTGWSGIDCVNHIQALRELALTNDSFVAAVCMLPERVRDRSV